MPAQAAASAAAPARFVDDELALIASLVPLAHARVIELGCGAAQLARRLVQAHDGSHVTGFEVDARQHAANLAAPAQGITFERGIAQQIPAPDAAFDLALMLKSLHHVPAADMDRALDEAWRVLREGGWLYVSEPVFDGPYNDIIRLFNDEGEVRAQAQQALARAIAGGRWQCVEDFIFDTPVSFRDFADFEARSIDVTFAERRLAPATRDAVRRRFEAAAGGPGKAVRFVRPMHVTLLRRHAPASQPRPQAQDGR